MFDDYPVGGQFRSPIHMCGRFVGNGTGSAPLPIANVPGAQGTKAKIARSGAGAYTVQFLDVPIGVYQVYDFWCACPSNNKMVAITPPTVGNNTFTLQVQYAANAGAIDVATTEELCFDVWASRSTP